MNPVLTEYLAYEKYEIDCSFFPSIITIIYFKFITGAEFSEKIKYISNKVGARFI